MSKWVQKETYRYGNRNYEKQLDNKKYTWENSSSSCFPILSLVLLYNAINPKLVIVVWGAFLEIRAYIVCCSSTKSEIAVIDMRNGSLILKWFIRDYQQCPRACWVMKPLIWSSWSVALVMKKQMNPQPMSHLSFQNWNMHQILHLGSLGFAHACAYEGCSCSQ